MIATRAAEAFGPAVAEQVRREWEEMQQAMAAVGRVEGLDRDENGDLIVWQENVPAVLTFLGVGLGGWRSSEVAGYSIAGPDPVAVLAVAATLPEGSPQGMEILQDVQVIAGAAMAEMRRHADEERARRGRG